MSDTREAEILSKSADVPPAHGPSTRSSYKLGDKTNERRQQLTSGGVQEKRQDVGEGKEGGKVVGGGVGAKGGGDITKGVTKGGNFYSATTLTYIKYNTA